MTPEAMDRWENLSWEGLTQDDHCDLLCEMIVRILSPEMWAVIEPTSGVRRRLLISALAHVRPDLKLPAREILVDGYPGLNQLVAARLLLGLPFGEGLTRAERHQWLLAGADNSPIEWILNGTGLEARSITVARWLVSVLASPEQKDALYRLRREGRLSDHTIDLVDSDCIGGPNEAWIRRKERMAVEEFGAEDLAPAPRWIRSLGGRVRVLTTAPALEREGREMAHCVGGYAGAVRDGRSVIVSIRAWGQRATIEYSQDRKIVQAKGPRNDQPTRLMMYLASRCVR